MPEAEVLIAGRARGIFRPRQMSRGALSIKTTVPRMGAPGGIPDRDRRYQTASLCGLLEIHDGPMLKALQNIQGGRMANPSSAECRPNRDYLAERFEDFKRVA